MSTSKTPRVLGLLPLLLGFAAAPVQALQMVTEEYPPFSYTENNKLTGISTEVVAAMGRRAKVPMTFESLLWKVAYERAQSKRDTCVYSTVRLENRERIFKWVGPIAAEKWGLFAKSGFSGDIKTVGDARPYRIGGVTHDYKVEWLKQSAVTNIDVVDDDKLNPSRLTLDRKQLGGIDLWVTGVYAAKVIAGQANVKDIKLVLTVREENTWLACHPSVSDDTIKALSSALAAIKKDGAYGKIIQPYDKKFAP